MNILVGQTHYSLQVGQLPQSQRCQLLGTIMEDVLNDLDKFSQSQHQVKEFVQSSDSLSIDVECFDFSLNTVGVNLGEDSLDIG